MDKDLESLKESLVGLKVNDIKEVDGKFQLELDGGVFIYGDTSGNIGVREDKLLGKMGILTNYPDQGNTYYDEAYEKSYGFKVGVHTLKAYELAQIADDSLDETFKNDLFVFLGDNPFNLLRRIGVTANPSSAFIMWLKNIGYVASQVDFDNLIYGTKQFRVYSYKEYKNLLLKSFVE